MNIKEVNLEKKIKNLLDKKHIRVREFCREIGMTTGNLYKIYERNSIDTKYLKVIAQKYEVPESYFVVEEQELEYQVKKVISNEKDLVKKYIDDNEHLKKELEAKEKEIALLRELVDSKNMIIEGLKGRN
jgi:transcriptional regulator with XRE-family HTH domain